MHLTEIKLCDVLMHIHFETEGLFFLNIDIIEFINLFKRKLNEMISKEIIHK